MPSCDEMRAPPVPYVCGARHREVDEDAEAEAAVDAAGAEPVALGAERAVVRQLQHRVERLLVRELLEEEPGGRGVRVHVGGQEVPAAHLDGIELQLARDAIDHRLHDERGDRMADGAVLGHRRLVLEAPRGRAPRSRGSGRGRASCAESGRTRRRSSAGTSRRRRRGQVVEAHAEDGAVALDRDLGGDAVVARVDVGLERLDAIGEELHGPAEHHRQRAGRDLVRVRVDLQPERARRRPC